MTDFHSDHDAISDRMPAVAAGRARWSVSEARHLAVCAACRREWAVVHRAMRLGADIEPALSLDEAAIARAVLGRLRSEQGSRATTTMRRRMWAVAGAIGAAGLAAGLAFMTRTHAASPERPAVAVTSNPPSVPAPTPSVPAPVRTAQAELSVPELDDVPAEALDTVLRLLDRPFKADEVLDANWGDIESREFERGFSTISTARR